MTDTDDEATVRACPECERSLTAADGFFYCQEHGRVEEPIRRPRKPPFQGSASDHLTAALDADPDDYP